MAEAISDKIEFEHLLSHTFPGFFSAITLFMLLDVWSPFNLTLRVMTDINTLIAFFGLVLIIGTIIGVIIDYIHHWIIEDLIFKQISEIQLLTLHLNRLAHQMSSKSHNLVPFCDDGNILIYYFFRSMGPDPINFILHLRKAKYCYSEFYSNTFISLIPFSLVAPFYMFKNLYISWPLCVSLTFAGIILSFISLFSSYQSYLNYYKSLYYYINSPKETNGELLL
jgi:hypothetical protein